MKFLMNLPESGFLRMVTLNHNAVDSKYRDYFTELFSVIGYDKKLQIDLKHEPTNPVDEFAIKVYAHGIPIGYILHQDAVDFNFNLHLIKRLVGEDKIRFYCNFYSFDPLKNEKGGNFRVLTFRIKKT